MKIMFATAHPFMPQMFGGMQRSMNALATSLMKRGHSVSLCCGLTGQGWIGIRARLILKLLRRKAALDTGLGYPVWRSWFAWNGLDYAASAERPDLIVVLAGQPARMALAAQKTGIPVLMMLQNVEFDDHGGDFSALGPVPCVANSRFTANKYRETYGVDPIVIHPMIDSSRYKTETTRENVTFINPHPLKGLDLALAIADKCPDIPFSFIETWSADEHQALLARTGKFPNITLQPPVSDMRKIYEKARLLLAPSRWEEAYGRVATEAQFSGIPVIASNRGGLPEAVGEGGVLLDPDGPLEPWVEAINRLWHDSAAYQDISAKATAHSQRPALNLVSQLDAWERAMKTAAGQT